MGARNFLAGDINFQLVPLVPVQGHIYFPYILFLPPPSYTWVASRETTSSDLYDHLKMSNVTRCNLCNSCDRKMGRFYDDIRVCG